MLLKQVYLLKRIKQACSFLARTACLHAQVHAHYRAKMSISDRKYVIGAVQRT